MSFELEEDNDVPVGDYVGICPKCGNHLTFWHNIRCGECDQRLTLWCPLCLKHRRLRF